MSKDRAIAVQKLVEISYPKKMKFFTWTIIHERINTMEVIQRKYPNSCVNPNWCTLSKSHNDEMNHLFIYCKKTRTLGEKLHWQTGWFPQGGNTKSLCLSLCTAKLANRRNIIIFNIAVALCGRFGWKETTKFSMTDKQAAITLGEYLQFDWFMVQQTPSFQRL